MSEHVDPTLPCLYVVMLCCVLVCSSSGKKRQALSRSRLKRHIVLM
jgi:hypothetical protein